MRHKIRKILVRFKIYPKCFSPCPPFYDICNRQDLRKLKCRLCQVIYNWYDYIE